MKTSSPPVYRPNNSLPTQRKASPQPFLQSPIGAPQRATSPLIHKPNSVAQQVTTPSVYHPAGIANSLQCKPPAFLNSKQCSIQHLAHARGSGSISSNQSFPVSSPVRRTTPVQSNVSHPIVQRVREMRSNEDLHRYKNVKVRSQLRREPSSGRMPFDPNCGRYCVDAAIRYVAGADNPNLPGDTLHLLPEAELRNFTFPVIGTFRDRRWGWSPDEEGQEVTRSLWKRAANDGADNDWNANAWFDALRAHGTLIVGGDLALFGRVGHYVLVTGVQVGIDDEHSYLIYKDPIGGSRVTKTLAWMKRHIDTINRLANIDSLRAHAPLAAYFGR
jgi:hypothetical protein